MLFLDKMKSGCLSLWLTLAILDEVMIPFFSGGCLGISLRVILGGEVRWATRPDKNGFLEKARVLHMNSENVMTVSSQLQYPHSVSLLPEVIDNFS
jgi:hypothetical protein